MSRKVKVSAWIMSATAIVTTLLALAVYSTDRAESATTVAVVHESRHVQTEYDVKRIDGSMEDHFQIIQSQLAAGHEMNLMILERVIRD